MHDFAEENNDKLLAKASEFFRAHIISNHIENIRKTSSLQAFDVNPFTVKYLATLIDGEITPKSMAKALIYPRVLGTSLTTTFGTQMQKFCSVVLPNFGSAIPGIDLEFIDKIDQRKKYCQMKAGPNTINNDDITSISNHFSSVRNIARTNNLSIEINDLVVGVVYGQHQDLNTFYRKLEKQYPILVGNEFWKHLTGDKDFYNKLIATFVKCSEDNGDDELIRAINSLANEIENEQI